LAKLKLKCSIKNLNKNMSSSEAHSYTDVTLYVDPNIGASALVDSLNMVAVRIQHPQADRRYHANRSIVLLHGDVPADVALAPYLLIGAPYVDKWVGLQKEVLDLHARLAATTHGKKVFLCPRPCGEAVSGFVFERADRVDIQKQGFHTLTSPSVALVLPECFRECRNMAGYYEPIIHEVALQWAMLSF
jgi:hypothetical protein